MLSHGDAVGGPQGLALQVLAEAEWFGPRTGVEGEQIVEGRDKFHKFHVKPTNLIKSHRFY